MVMDARGLLFPGNMLVQYLIQVDFCLFHVGGQSISCIFSSLDSVAFVMSCHNYFLSLLYRELMDPELRRCWSWFILLPIKTLFLAMCLQWFLVELGWVRSFYAKHNVCSLQDINIFYKLRFFSTGTPALTSRGFVEEDFAKVADFFDTAVKLALKVKAETKGT